MNSTVVQAAIGVDVGGTSIKVSVCDSAGGILIRDRWPTAETKDPEAACRRIASFAAVAEKSGRVPEGKLRGIGMAVPGVLNLAEGQLEEVTNLPQWERFPLQNHLRRLFDCPAVLVNDANAAAYAEYRLRNMASQSLALVTLGTGVGCGIVLLGTPWAGDFGAGGELGHLPIAWQSTARRCACGAPGHLEAYLGAAGVVKTYEECRASIADPGNFEENELSPEEIAARAEQGDITAIQTVELTAERLGAGLAALSQVINPSVIALGGAMNFGGGKTRTGRLFLERVRAATVARVLTQIGKNLIIDFAGLGGDAGMIGSALLGLDAATQDEEEGLF